MAAAKVVQRKQTVSSGWQGWMTALLVGAASLLFFLVIGPMLKSKHPLVEQPAPDFNLEVIHQGDDGSRLQLSQLRGRPVIIDFWASWCGPCRAQAPIIDEVARAKKSDAIIVGINTNDSRASALSFARGRRLSYPSVFDPSGSVATRYAVRAMPTMVIIDREGKVRFVQTGVVSRSKIESELSKL